MKQLCSVALIWIVACRGEERSPPPASNIASPCGSPVNCYTESLKNLVEAQKTLESARQEAGDLLPPGTVIAFAANRDLKREPPGWLFCDGRELDVNDPRYKRLFQAIGTIYGGDAKPKFKIPDYQGYFLRGVSGDSKIDPDADKRTPVGSARTGSIQDAVGTKELAAVERHQHPFSGQTFVERPPVAGHVQGGHDTKDFTIYLRDGNTGYNNDAGETRPVNMSVHYLIRY